MAKFIKIYELLTDKRQIEFLKEFVFSKRFHQINGQPVDGFIPGTNEWFAAINKGDIHIHEVQGIISRVYMSGHNDWPEFEIDSNGTKTQWTREGDDKMYIPNKEVILRYTKQKLINGHVDIYKTIFDVQISSS